MALDWEALPRLLQELCEGPCMHYREILYALDYPNGRRGWYCRGCYVDRWIAAGRPARCVLRGDD